jgi:broad specificity phosphatase PhoE
MPQNFRSRLYFIRHGETDWNVAGRLQGQRDIPLNGKGRDQAAAAGRLLRDLVTASHLGELDFVASPLLRTRETMGLARAAMGLPPAPFKHLARHPQERAANSAGA